MTHIPRLFTALFALALLALPFGGSAAAQGDSAYTAVVTEERVDVRSGAGRAYYVVGELEEGQQVRVVEVLFDETWYKIQVPTTVYSYVSKAFVNAQGDGSVGVVNADRTEFKAASLRGPGESYRVQGTFNQGDRVQIVAEEGNFYKIASPSESFVFIPAGTIRRVTAADMVPAPPTDEETPAQDPADNTDEPEVAQEPEAVTPPADEETAEETVEETTDEAADPADEGPSDEQAQQPADDETMTDEADDDVEGAQPADDETTATDETTESTDAGDEAAQATGEETPAEEGDRLPARPDVEVTTPARSDALKAVEMDLLPYFAVGIEDRPLDHMEAGYRDILATGDLPDVDRRIVEVRLRTIARQREILAAISRVEAARAPREPRTQVPDLESLPRGPVDYNAVGLLQSSSVYDGQSLPRMYRIVDPTGRTIAYVAPTPLIDESDLLNTLVGVVGSASYDPALKLQIITPSRLDALAAEAE